METQNKNHSSELSEFEKTVASISHLQFDEALVELKKLSAEIFKELRQETHTIYEMRHDLKKRTLRFVIEQYSVFSREAIHMLLDAMIRNYDWPELFKELQENINEEKGKFTKDVPHLEMMRRGYLQDLKIDTDNVDYCCATSTFIRRMRTIFNNNDNAFSAGALIAFEGHAIPEFHIIDGIIDAYNSGLSDDTLTKMYINGHKDFEIEHEAHLIDSIRPYINENNIGKMCKGFLMVSLSMSTWWTQLSVEVMRMEVESALEVEVEEFDIHSRFTPQV